MKTLITLLLLPLAGCASASLAQKLSVVSFEEKAKPNELQSIGGVDGKDCTWYIAGYPMGAAPSARNAFLNAASQKEDALVPGQSATNKGAPLKVIKNVSVERSGFDAWILARSCVVVNGAGFR